MDDEQAADRSDAGVRSVEVRLPASTSNLGAGFDCFGLALQLYLTIRATIVPESTVACRIRIIGGKENGILPRGSENLIYRSLAYVANREQVSLPAVHLAVHNEIPISRGLGSSAAAIVAGVKLCELLTGRQISNDRILQYATEFEGHPDNVSASLLGGFVVTCTAANREVLAVKRSWPGELKIIVVSPDSRVDTRLARANLRRVVDHSDAVYNLQRTALFNAALAERRYDVLWEAMHDRLHQQRRQSLVPGLAEALALPRMEGLHGLALSGAGPSVLAVAEQNFDAIGQRIAQCFQQYGINSTVRLLEIDNEGCQARIIK